jgi:predicted phage terminase large subunit-like protein
MEDTEKDLRLIAERLRARFTEEELDRLELLKKPFDASMRRGLAAVDLEFFKRFYLGEHFPKPFADMHREFDEHFAEVVRGRGQTYDVVAWPRGFGKTTHVDLGNVAWCICFVEDLQRYHILLIADSHDQAKAYLSTLRDELEHNERILEDFGNLKGPKWQEGDIVTSNGVAVRALGSRMKIRGRKFKQYRPDLVIGDDLESIESVMSDTTREKDAQWVARSVLKAGNPDRCAFIFIGTIMHYDAVLQRLLDNPMFQGKKYKAVTGWAKREDLWDQWQDLLTNLADPIRDENALRFFKEHEEDMLEGAESAWSEGYSYYELMLIMVTGESLAEGSSFWAEMQNEPLSPEDRLFGELGLFRQEWRAETGIWLVPLSGRPAVRLKDCAIFGSIDPSLGIKKAARDPCATEVLAKAPTGQMFNLESKIEYLTPDQMIAEMVELGKRYVFTQFGVESVQFQALFASDAARESAAQDVYLPIVPVPQRANKLLRIQSLQPDISNEYILFPEHGQRKLKKQLRDAPKAAHDDGPDALEIATRLAKAWKGLDSVGTTQAESHTFGGEEAVRAPMGSRDPYEAYERAALVEESKERVQRGEKPLDVEEELWFPIIV